MIRQITFQQYGNQQNWVNGKFHPSTSKKTISVISPYFDKEIATVPESNYADLDNAVQQAKAAFPLSKAINSANSSTLFSMMNFKLNITSALSRILRDAQDGNAAFAFFTAISKSAKLDSGTVAISLSK